MQPLNRQTAHIKTTYPERVIQFGGGNFLRAFVDWMVEILNEQTNFAGSIVIVKATPHGSYADLDAQEGLFHVRLHGQGASDCKLITAVSRTVNPYEDHAAFLSLARQPEIRFVVSNTTEAGIVFDPREDATALPAKLTALLYERYRYYGGDLARGWIILPCELIEQNGDLLRQFVLDYATLWKLDAGFSAWLQTSCVFCNTLVDRIVSGFPKDAAILEQIGFDDRLLVEGEAYHSWIIQAPAWVGRELPFTQTNLNVQIVDDVRPYREMKVRILNGTHTAMMPLGILLGYSTVREAIEDPLLGAFLRDLLFDEIVPTMPGSADFAEAVLVRLGNPFIEHRLASIALNSLAKFKARLLPSLLAATQQNRRLVLAFAALIRFYQGEWQGQALPVNDDPALMAWLHQLWDDGLSMRALAARVLSNQALWGTDLSTIPQLVERLGADLEKIETEGIESVLQNTDGQHDA